VLNIYAPNTKITKFVKETLLQLKSHTENHALRLGDFSTSHLPIHRSSIQNQNRKIFELIGLIHEMDLTDIYRTFYSNTKEYTFFLAPRGTFSKVENILGYKAFLNRYQKTLNNTLQSTRPLVDFNFTD
jgi:exonuclease III